MNQNLQNYEKYRDDIQSVIQNVGQIMYGMRHVTEHILIGLICSDHILIEDVPGTGKTKMTKTVSKILDLQFRRIQGTPDLLPGDLTGVNVFDQSKGEFKFVPGPIFTNILLFDEINRASPKTQSALLEAMEEKQVTVDNQTFKLDKPFFVVATQNPIEFIGTYPLPQAQLDRFLLKSTIGYPPREAEKQIILENEVDLDNVQLPKLDHATLSSWQQEYKQVFIKEDLVEKILNVIQKTRDRSKFALGISPRSGKKLVKALKARAFMYGRDFVNKDDIYELFIPVMLHRIYANEKGTEANLLRDYLKEEKF